jgi:aminoglycoside phosphotransferase (APT) family kinase protein
VPAPRYVDPAGDFLVLEYVEGERVEAPALDRLAAVLARIHRVDPAAAAFLPGRALADVSARNPGVLLHGDFWPGNTLWRDGRLVAVVDWEDAAVGDPLADVANARLELVWALGVEAMEEFTHRYREATDVDLTDLPLWDLRAERRLGARMTDWGLDGGTLQSMEAAREAFGARAREELAAR